VHNFWGWQVVLDIFLGGVAAGVMIVSAITKPNARARFVPPAALSVALLALLLDLGNKLHAFRFYTAFRLTSPMSWGAWILLAAYPATIAYALRPSAALRRINLALGIALGSYTGVLLTAVARPAWASIALPPLFLVSAVVSGAAVCKLASANDEEHGCVCKCLVGALLAELALLFAYFIDVRHVPYTAPMWSLVVIAGLAIPAFLQILELRGRIKPVTITPALILAGGFARRWIIVAAGQVPHA
jgi:protein NrfD